MKKKMFLFTTLIYFASIFLAINLFAGSTLKDVIEMENKAYEKHKRSIVEFQHKKHSEERNIECGACHHDENGEPLKLKAGDHVSSCMDCHNIASERPKGKDAPRLTPKEKLKYHAEAVHKKCKACHKKDNRKNNNKAAPATCKGCHPKK